jgi:hypothetical protein
VWLGERVANAGNLRLKIKRNTAQHNVDAPSPRRISANLCSEGTNLVVTQPIASKYQLDNVGLELRASLCHCYAGHAPSTEAIAMAPR